ncbi:MAG: AAA family ATPase [Lachnospiraceae bacterium]|nr:AAA family ATPase [Lachnospiraceae bacterium]
MNSIYRDIFRAIHEGKWLGIEYCNKENQITKYWIGIRNLNVAKRTLAVDGLHLSKYTTDTYDYIYIDSILSSKVIEGSYCPVNRELVRDVYLNPHKYKGLFDNTANLKILNYLEMCNRMDAVPYYLDFELVRFLDRESFKGDAYELSEEQFRTIVQNFQYKAEEKGSRDGRLKIQQLAMNVLSIHTAKGLYVLAYRKLQLDVKRRVLRPDDEITICTEYTLDGTTENIRRYLDAEEYELLKNFEENQETIKDCITKRRGQSLGTDDMPYVIGLGMDIALDLHKEYESIVDMYHKNEVPVPIKAFFGDLLNRPIRKKAYPIALINQRVNMDQLLAINNGMKYPVAYIQGPPGTGKTNTIINTIATAFFNEKTVLFASYNNHPINSVFEKLSSMQHKGRTIPFPILRLGNNEKVKEALSYMKALYYQVQEITVFEKTLDRNKDDRAERAKKLSDLLKRYEELLDLKERSETLNRLLEYEKKGKQSLQMLPFQTDLSGRQLRRVNIEIEKTGAITDEQALELLDDHPEELGKYLYYTSAKYIQKLNEPKNKDLRDIILTEDEETQAVSFAKYLSDSENIKKLQKIFPIIATTCISAHRLGKPEPLFDMTIIDEASQCNTAISLVPIIRGESLMLVGDPQQLNPVIVLDEMTNQKLKKRYNVSDDYDYRKNSIYKTYLACDAVSDEILLHNHYRCHKQIIEFNNKKYYNSKLHVMTESKEAQPLIYVNVQNDEADYKNTAPAEASEIIKYASANKDKSIGVITPFVNQKNLIEKMLKSENLSNVTCGTVHAFQGDEKDVVLFSTAITNQTKAGTYEWLKNNKELINVATSRAKEKLIVLSNTPNLERLHQKDGEDDLFELVQYVRTNGQSKVTQKQTNSRALGVKPFSTATEEAFLQNLTHALENIWLSQSAYKVYKEVAISHVFTDNINYSDLFYNGRFDFVVYEVLEKHEIPVLAIELDGKEHFENDIVKNRDCKKNEICKAHNLQIIRVENSYARRYNHIKEILLNYFSIRH